MSMWFGGRAGALDASLDAIPRFWHPHIHKAAAFKHQCHGVMAKLLECFAIALHPPDHKFFVNAHREDLDPGDGLPHDKERQSMAYFGHANPGTFLEPIVSSTIAKYLSNGKELRAGMTMAEFYQMGMEGIYGRKFNGAEALP